MNRLIQLPQCACNAQLLIHFVYIVCWGPADSKLRVFKFYRGFLNPLPMPLRDSLSCYMQTLVKYNNHMSCIIGQAKKFTHSIPDYRFRLL